MSLASIGAVAASLIVLGSFLLLSVNFDHILVDVESQVEITAYLEDTADDLDIARLKGELSGIYGVKEVNFVSKEDAMEEFQRTSR